MIYKIICRSNKLLWSIDTSRFKLFPILNVTGVTQLNKTSSPSLSQWCRLSSAGIPSCPPACTPLWGIQSTQCSKLVHTQLRLKKKRKKLLHHLQTSAPFSRVAHSFHSTGFFILVLPVSSQTITFPFVHPSSSHTDCHNFLQLFFFLHTKPLSLEHSIVSHCMLFFFSQASSSLQTSSATWCIIYNYHN